MPRKPFPFSEVYRLLEPGPVILLTTSHKGRANILSQSWHVMMEFTPPLVGSIVSNRNLTFQALKATRECVINIPTVEIATQAVGCGNCSGRRVDKFKTFRLTAVEASQVKAPLIAECYANLECKAIDTKLVSKYCFLVLEVVQAWINPARRRPRTIHHLGSGSFMVAGETIKVPCRAK